MVSAVLFNLEGQEDKVSPQPVGYVYYSAIAYFLQSPESYMTVTTHIKAYIM